MMATAVKNDIMHELERLNRDQQVSVLRFVRSLTPPAIKGVPGNKLSAYAGCMAADDLSLMVQAINEGCERIDSHAW